MRRRAGFRSDQQHAHQLRVEARARTRRISARGGVIQPWWQAAQMRRALLTWTGRGGPGGAAATWPGQAATCVLLPEGPSVAAELWHRQDSSRARALLDRGSTLRCGWLVLRGF